MPPILPTFEQMRELDPDALLGLLINHTGQYTALIKQEGFSEISEIYMDNILKIQAHIEI